jgi:CrcB protein
MDAAPREAPMIWLAVVMGGAVGSLLRHAVNELFARGMSTPVPYATAVVNLVGAGTIGLLAGLIAAGRLEWSPPLRAFVLVGVLGGFTTFSSYMLDTLTLTYRNEPGLAFVNLTGQIMFGLAAVWSGYYLGVGRP